MARPLSEVGRQWSVLTREDPTAFRKTLLATVLAGTIRESKKLIAQ